MKALLFLLLGFGTAAAAQPVGFDVYFLGERHDNPHHHLRQADIVSALEPSAIVWEMLTAQQAENALPELYSDEQALAAATGWEHSGWPDFSIYYPIFAAAQNARMYGAGVPRDVAKAAMSDPVSAFGGDASAFGLSDPLPETQQTERQEMQAQAHCGALPEHLLPAMVAVQRLRDAELARVALLAHQQTGGPVVVITGNGHARADWGAPSYLAKAAPELALFSLAQVEGQADETPPPVGQFDAVERAPAVIRPDPCLAFAPASD